MRERAVPLAVTVLSGLLVGFLSATSNRVAPDGLVDHTVWSATAQYAGGVANSLVAWFWVPFALGRLESVSVGRANTWGAVFMATAFVTHDVHTWLHADVASGVGPAPPMASATLWLTLAIAVAGGVIAGTTGFLSRRRPVTALVLALVVVAELARRPLESWRSGISAAENTTFVLLACAVVVGLAARSRAKAASR
ncbi:hypothetical protein KIK06_28605 [Nocardiopsis sp. EMB25]|uniref:hypothetical protein n=2 Tax=Nocardiopsis TaxID=2013 RepID=UPI0022840218|nr:hypothetical protein [Nocardiopsis sp. EMB25]MCY9787844.1 hypothetical protein [Nocardiopsis sp. EMB25]